MTHGKTTILILLLCSLFACNPTSKQTDNSKTLDTTKSDTIKKPIVNLSTITKKIYSSTQSERLEDQIIDSIFKLQEVKEWSKYLEDQTKGKRHAKLWIADKPNLADQKYYWIKVGEDNGTNLVTQFNFYVYPDSIRIMYLNTLDDSELTLEEWRKTKNGM